MFLDEKLNDKLTEIDQRISKEASIIKDFAMELSFVPIIEFELNEETGALTDPIFNTNGVYFFEIKNEGLIAETELWRTRFQPLWTNSDVIWTPGFKMLRFRAHQSFSEWVPFYIGKSKSVISRVNEHIHQPRDRHTFSMKLKARKNLHGQVFKISWIPMGVTNYDMIAPVIENALRQRFNPLIGKQ